MASDDLADLKSVRGIGPKREARLKAAGIKDLGKLARTPANEVAALLAGLPGGMPEATYIEAWLEQAAALAAGSGRVGEAGSAAEGTVPGGEPVRHSFTVEVRLPPADGGGAAAVTIRHVNTRDEETWNGWDPARMVTFVEERAGIRPDPPPGAAPPDPGPAHPRETVPLETVPQETHSEAALPKTAPPDPAPPESGGDGLRTYAVEPASGPVLTACVAGFTATLTFGAQALGLPPDASATVSADVFARRMLTRGSVLAGSAAVSVGPGEQVFLEIPCRLPGQAGAGGPATVFAVVRVRAPGAREWKPARRLADANLAISPMIVNARVK